MKMGDGLIRESKKESKNHKCWDHKKHLSYQYLYGDQHTWECEKCGRVWTEICNSVQSDYLGS